MAYVSDEPEPRVEVIEALCKAMREHDDELLAAMPDATKAERAKAADLAAAWKADDIISRQDEVWALLYPESSAATGATFEFGALFDSASPEVLARLGELYDDLPPGAQAEYDRRYGKPQRT